MAHSNNFMETFVRTKTIAVVLAGCGNKDGTEITEAVSLMIGLSQSGAEMEFFAPDLNFTPKNFLSSQSLNETRNVMTESARITRSQMRDLKTLNAQDFDGLAFPGGYGAALHLSNWAQRGAMCEVLPDIDRAIQSFYAQSKPIAAICIAPTLLARVLGRHKITVTIGQDKETAGEIAKTGAIHENCPVNDFVTDRRHKIITTPAFVYGDAKFHEVFAGIQGLSKEFAEMA